MKYGVDGEIIMNDIVLLAADGEVDSCKLGPDMLVIEATRDSSSVDVMTWVFAFRHKEASSRSPASSEYDYVL